MFQRRLGQSGEIWQTIQFLIKFMLITEKAVLDATEKQIEVALKMVGSIAEANYCPVEVF